MLYDPDSKMVFRVVCEGNRAVGGLCFPSEKGRAVVDDFEMPPLTHNQTDLPLAVPRLMRRVTASLERGAVSKKAFLAWTRYTPTHQYVIREWRTDLPRNVAWGDLFPVGDAELSAVEAEGQSPLTFLNQFADVFAMMSLDDED